MNQMAISTKWIGYKLQADSKIAWARLGVGQPKHITLGGQLSSTDPFPVPSQPRDPGSQGLPHDAVRESSHVCLGTSRATPGFSHTFLGHLAHPPH